MLQKIFISLGSNKGNRFQNLQEAINEIYYQVGNILKISSVYETASWGFESDDFLNCCIEITSDLSALELLEQFKKIEKNLGRTAKTTVAYEARVIDIDILFYNDDVISEKELRIPHPSMQDRKFVLQPLHDIASNIAHPIFKKTVTQLLKECKDSSKIKRSTESLHNPFEESMFSNYRFIALEGNIGCGKTTLAKMMARDFNAKLILERFADNAFLPKFYEDQHRFAFSLEMSFLADRYQQLSEDISQYDLFKEFVVTDYHVSKSLTFAKVTLPEDEFSLYRKFFNVIYKDIQEPDLYIYLYQNTERLLENIKKRGRVYEQSIQSEYLENINKGYVEFIKSQPNLNVKIIDVSEMDFVKNRADYLKILKQIIA